MKRILLVLLALCTIMVGCSKSDASAEPIDIIVDSDVKANVREESVSKGSIEESTEIVVDTEEEKPWVNECLDVDQFYFTFMEQSCLFPCIVDDFFVHSILWEFSQEELLTEILPDKEYEMKTVLGESDLLCTVAHHNEEMIPYEYSSVIGVECYLLSGGKVELFDMTIDNATTYKEIKEYFGEPTIHEKFSDSRVIGYRTKNCLISFMFDSEDKCYYVLFDDEMFWPTRE